MLQKVSVEYCAQYGTVFMKKEEECNLYVVAYIHIEHLEVYIRNW